MAPELIVKPQESRADGGAAISVRNLRVNYGDREILHSISFDISPGETLVILGLAEVLGSEQLLGTDDLRAFPRGPFGVCQSLAEVGIGIGRACGLD